MNKAEKAAREYAGGIQVGIKDSQHDKYIGFKAGVEWCRENELKIAVEALKLSKDANWDAYNEIDALLNGSGPSDLQAVCDHTKHAHDSVNQALKTLDKIARGE